MRKLISNSSAFINKVKRDNIFFYFIRKALALFFFFVSSNLVAQTLPAASSCNSGDLLLVSATLPPNPGDDPCGTCIEEGSAITRKLILSINNKTGSTRTSFAFWGTLEIYNSSGTLVSTRSLSRCRGPIPKNTTTPVDFDTIQYICGQSLKLTNLFLAWTSANNNEICPLNSATINPKCGTLPSINLVAGLDAISVVTDATCTAGGSIAVSPYGGNAPYSVTIRGVTHTGVGAGETRTFTGLSVGDHSIMITDASDPAPCTAVKTRTVGSPSAVTANAGDDFTKTCTSNASGKQIGETSASGFSYSWSPTTGLSNSAISNPNANPAGTTTYTVTKTNTSSGCTDDDEVIVTVDNEAVTANAGVDFTKTCTSNASGKQIGETSAEGFSYSWSPTTGLSNSTISNPNANPSGNTTYTVTKTNTTTGCSNTDQVAVTVDTEIPDAPTICIVQPSLCGPTTGTVTILSPTEGYEYSINNGTSFQSGNVFIGLAPGSVTGIKVRKLVSGCVSPSVSCDNAVACPLPIEETATQVSPLIESIPSQIKVKAYPNPFSDKVKFIVTSSVAGNGILEVYNMMGQKVKTVYTGSISVGSQTFELSLPPKQISNLVYVLKVDDKKMTGKLLQINQ